MNTKNILLGLCAVATLASCQKKDLEIPQTDNPKGSSPVFTSGAATKAGGNQWTSGDKVGIYMVRGYMTESSIVEGAKNISHLANNISNDRLSCRFTPINSSEKMFFPNDGMAVDFISYYPYKEGVELYYPIDLSDQSNLEKIDLMVARTYGKGSSDAIVPLTFEHQLARFDISVAPIDGESLDGAMITISGFAATGLYDLSSSYGIHKDIQADIELALDKNGKVTALLFPYKHYEAHGIITLTTKEGKVRKYPVIAPTMESGRKYAQELRDQYFPDAGFRNRLVYNGFIQVNNDIDPYNENNKKLFDEITNLYLATSEIETLKGIEYFTKLEVLNCSENRISELDVSQNIMLKEVICYRNQITNLILPENSNISILMCSNNKLNSINVPPLLTKLTCNNNNITSLDLSECLVLADIDCNDNLLDALDVSKCATLKSLKCYSNNIKSLDISKNNKLFLLSCYDNQLSELDITMLLELGLNHTWFLCGNQKYNKNLTLFLDEGQKSRWNINRLGEDPNNKNVILSIKDKFFPDINFRKRLIELGFIEENNDINPNNATNKKLLEDTKNLDVREKNIFSLKGVEYFTCLISLDCYKNKLSSLDVSKIKTLTYLDCSENFEISELDISENKLLESLTADNCRLKDLDLSKNTELKVLNLYFCNLTKIDLTKNVKLADIQCIGNEVDMLDVTSLRALKSLRCSRCKLTSLDLSNNTLLQTLFCDYNAITSIDVSNNTALEKLGCGSNQLTTLMLPNTETLRYLACENNKLTNFNISLNIGLTTLITSNNQLTSLDLSNNMALSSLECSINELALLDLSNNMALSSLECSINKLALLDLSKNINLKILYCKQNQLTALSLPNGDLLQELDCENNKIASLDASQNLNLTKLRCNNNKLQTLSLPTSTTLKYIWCHVNELQSLNISTCTNLYGLSCAENLLPSLDLSKNSNLIELSCYANNMNTLDVSNMSAVTAGLLTCGKQNDNSILTLTINSDQSVYWNQVKNYPNNINVNTVVK